MYYLGIVGALSSLGQGVIAALERRPAEFKIVFKVDDRYPQKNLPQGEFQNLEQVISSGINPSLVLDFGIADKSFDRVKFYRENEMPAVVQTIFGEDKCHALQNVRGLSEGVYSPLILVPDFSVIKASLVNHLKVLAGYLLSDIKRIHVDILYNTERYNGLNQWLYWGYDINEALGKPAGMYRQDGCTLTCGLVHFGFMRISSMSKNEENIHIQIIAENGDVPLHCEMRYNLLKSRVEGAMKVLDWYVANCKDRVLVGAKNNMLKDTLSKLI